MIAMLWRHLHDEDDAGPGSGGGVGVGGEYGGERDGEAMFGFSKGLNCDGNKRYCDTCPPIDFILIVVVVHRQCDLYTGWHY